MTQEATQVADARKTGVDTGLLVFYLTALAYVAAFGYEAGYLSYFGLPPDLVVVDLKQLLLAFGLIAALVGTLWIGSDVAADMWSQLQAPKVWGRLLSRMSTVCLIIFVAWLTEQRWYYALAILFPVVVNIFAEFVMPLFDRNDGTYPFRVERWMKHADALEGKGLRAAMSRFGPVSVNAVVYAVLTFMVGGLLGVLVARFQDVFLVSTEDPPCIVIRTGPSGFLCQAFDRRSHVLKPQYRFISEEEADFTAEKLGSFAKSRPAIPSVLVSQSSIAAPKTSTGNTYRAEAAQLSHACAPTDGSRAVPPSAPFKSGKAGHGTAER